MRKKSIPKKEFVRTACGLLKELIYYHNKISPAEWSSALWTTLIALYLGDKQKYEDFCIEADRAKEFYKDNLSN